MDKVILLSELAESVKVIEGDLIEFFTILGFSLSKNKGKTTVTGNLQTEEGELDAVQTARQFVDLAEKLSQETNTKVSIVDLANQVKSNQAKSTQAKSTHSSLPPANSEPTEPMDDELKSSDDDVDPEVEPLVEPEKENIYNQVQGAKQFSVKSSDSKALDTYGSLLEHLAAQNEAMAPVIALIAAEDLMKKARNINPFTDPRTKGFFEELKKREAGQLMDVLQANPDGQQVEVMELGEFMRNRLCQKSTNALPESTS
ncbi:hypothetical protein NG799_01535 [Laspinema sp. D1]|uniref:Uncharacterized protein n=1 Tax=Laspinema palackyanum D2a TaxID=2953684 RepID=A0ABT2MJT2_9CYAN|nr:hypothetical protein [Laspinema sp. D2a]